MRRCHLALLPLPATAFAAAFAAFTPAIGFVAHHSLGVERGRHMPALRLNGRECGRGCYTLGDGLRSRLRVAR